jgi:hypothetical protein
MKKLVSALAGLVLLSGCMVLCGDEDCTCPHEKAKHPAAHQGPKKGFKKPAKFQGPKKVSEMKQGN